MTGRAADPAEFELLQLLRVRGVVARPDAAALVAADVLDRATATAAVEVRTVGGKELLHLAKVGEEHRLEYLRKAREEVDFADLENAYEAGFLPLNARFKDFCARWQAADERFELLEELIEIDARIGELLGHFAAFPHYARYREGFRDALERAAGGDLEAVTGPLGATYHNLWFELHEDLLWLLGRGRAEEDG